MEAVSFAPKRTMELQVQVFSRMVGANAIWPIVVNRGISFGDLKTIVAVQFGLQGQVIFFRHNSQVGMDSSQAITDILENHDLLLVQEVLVDISSNPRVARVPSSSKMKGSSRSKRWPLPSFTIADTENAEVVHAEAYTYDENPYCISPIPTQSLNDAKKVTKKSKALCKAGNVVENDRDVSSVLASLAVRFLRLTLAPSP